MSQNVFEGKNLKLALCMLKHLYSDVGATADGLRTKKKEYQKKLKIAFPYYEDSTLDNFVEDFIIFVLKGNDKRIREKVSDLHRFYFQNRYKEEVEAISSPDLYHFVNKRYLLTILKNQYLYPSYVSIEEYKNLLDKYEGALADVKGLVLEHSVFVKTWSENIVKFKELIQKGTGRGKFNKYLKEKSFLPAMNCFTELPTALLSLHARHYGGYGIRFKKSSIVLRENLFFEQRVTNFNYIRPIYYCDNSQCSLPWIVMSKLQEGNLSKGDKRKLVTDLYLLKPVNDALYNPRNIYSVLNEREWRYVSFEKLFFFKKDTIARIVIPKADYERYLNGYKDDTLEELMKYCKEKGFYIDYI